MPIDVKTASYDDPVAQQLIAEMEIDLSRFYGERHYPPQDPATWSSPDGAMMVALYDTQLAGCGGFVRLDETTAELKRMFVRAGCRRRGIARAVLVSLEDTARKLGYVKMVLETGVPQVAAQQFYLSAAYAPITCWSPHDRDPTSVCFGRELAEGD
jgi:GNAT superfamily N-acetyltransferase